MKKSFVLFAVASTSLLSADQYYQQPSGYSSCPGGNCPSAGYNQGNQGYYQGSQGYYQGGQGNYQGGTQTYYQSNPSASSQGYYQTSPQYTQGTPQGMTPDQSNAQYNQNGRTAENPMNVNSPSMRGTAPSNPNAPSNPSSMQYTQPRIKESSYADKPATYTDTQRRDQKAVPDQDIAKDVHNVLAGWFTTEYPNVTFDVNNGVVTLNGSVDKQDDKSKIEAEVKKINGVKQVDNKITVGAAQKAAAAYYKPSSMTADSATKMAKNEKKFSQDIAASDLDRQLNSKIRDKLSNNWVSKNYDHITLKTTNGVVTVTGTVDSQDDIKKINDTIKGIDGVKSVNNQLTAKKK